MKLNLERLRTIGITLEAIRELEETVEWYSDTTKAGAVHVTVKRPGYGEHGVNVQFDRECYIEFAQARIQHMIDHLKERFPDFEYDPKASWHGDVEG
jgi:hypothetical protein